MRFGLQLHGTLPADVYGRLGARAEELGFEDVTLHDLLMRRPVWPVLTDVARATARVKVGPNVTHPFLQHPAVVAANLAHLDEVSSGRAVLGIGRGSLYELVGESPRRGLLAIEEAVHVIRMLTEGDAREWQGELFALGPGQGLRFGHRRRIPMHLGTFGPKGARLAGRVADGVRAAGQWDPAFMGRIRGWVEDGATDAGRDPAEVELVAENWTCLHPDRDVARSHARRILATFLPHLGPMLDFYRISEEEVAAARAASVHGDETALDRIDDATMDRFMAAGDAGDLRLGLDRLRDAGIDAVSFSGVLGPDPDLALEMLGDEIGPRTRSAT